MTDDDLSTQMATYIKRGDASGVRACVRGLDDKRRRALLPTVEAAFVEPEVELVRDGNGWISPGWPAGAVESRRAQALARIVCTTGAAALARVLEREWEWHNQPNTLVNTLLERNVDWLPALAQRLAERDRENEDEWRWQVIEQLRMHCGLPYFETDGYLRWLVSHMYGDLLAKLRADAQLVALIPRLLDVPGIGALFAWREWTDEWDPRSEKSYRKPAPREVRWSGAIGELVREGALERAVILDRTLGVLLRGASRDSARFFIALLDELSVTVEETVTRQSTYFALATDGPSAVATIALSTLKAAEAAGALALDDLWQLTSAVVTRSEKGLVRTQLTWVRDLVRRDPAAADSAALAIATGLRHEASDIAEKVLALLEKWWPQLGPETRNSLRADLALVAPSLTARSASLTGEAVAQPEPEPTSRRKPSTPAARRPLPPPVESLAEVRELISHADSTVDLHTVERICDGLLAFCGDLTSLRSELEPVVHPYSEYDPDWTYDVGDLLKPMLQHIVYGERPPSATREYREWAARGLVPPTEWQLPLFLRVTRERLQAIRDDVVAGRPARLVSLATQEPGVLDPDVLLRRVERCHEDGYALYPFDMDQAMVRLRPDARDFVRTQCSDLPIDVRTEPAIFLDAVTLHDDSRQAQPAFRRRLAFDDDDNFLAGELIRPNSVVARVVSQTHRGGLVGRFEEILTDPEPTAGDRWKLSIGGLPTWVSLLPWERESVAAAATYNVAMNDRALDDGSAAVLRALPDMGGPTGAATALLLARGATSATAAYRVLTADVALALDQAGELDAASWAQALAVLVEVESPPVRRIAETLRAVAVAGAWQCVWETCRSLLPKLLDAEVRETASVLAIASDAVATLNVRDSVDGLSAAAERPGKSRLTAEARRLRDLLSGT